ncbi:MAG: sodium:proton antiporter [Bacteroidia bacterium]
MEVIIAICVLLLLAYFFDLTAAFTKIPTVILLLLLGWVVRQAVHFFGFDFPDLEPLLPVFGTVGLILIVLEGTIDLELNISKIGIINKSFVGTIVPMLAMTFLIGYGFVEFSGCTFRQGIVNAIPFGVISSAIAIPSVRHLHRKNREFITYESSLSDVIGVLFFNFISFHQIINGKTFAVFGGQLIIMIIISMAATLLMSYLLNKIEHHIKFVPIIILIILIYELAKISHLPALIFVMILGLFLGNLDQLKNVKWMKFFNPEGLDKEVHKLEELTIEAAFLIRSLFFLLFGFLMETKEILNPETFVWALSIIAIIYAFRFIQLTITNLPIAPLLFVAPRGLITILLFISVKENDKIMLVSRSLVIQVILLSILVMMIGLMWHKPQKDDAKISEPHQNAIGPTEETSVG